MIYGKKSFKLWAESPFGEGIFKPGREVLSFQTAMPLAPHGHKTSDI